MKAKKGFTLRSVCGENVIVSEGKENIDFSNLICPNESSAYLWKNIQGKDFTAEDLTTLLTAEYEVDYDTALRDSVNLMQQWMEAGIVE